MFETITLEVVGGLITAVILTFLGFFYGRYFEKEKYKKRYDPALSNFSTNLGEAIMNAQRNTSIEEVNRPGFRRRPFGLSQAAMAGSSSWR